MKALRLDDPRVTTVATTGVVALLAWIALASTMSRAPGLDAGGHIPHPAVLPAPAAIAATAGMWVLMMFAMMLPAVTPMLAAYSDIAKRDPENPWGLAAGVFAAAYFLLWSLFAVAAAALQLALQGSSLLIHRGSVATPWLAGGLLVVAGVYQWLPVKNACLERCRSPMAFLLAHWRPGLGGAFGLGLRHGWFCLGCCVALMGLMFVFGTMAFWGMAALAAYCVAERLLPGAVQWGRWVGATLVAAGLIVWARSLFT